MKKTLPVEMGSVEYDWNAVWGTTVTRPTVAISLDENKIKGQILCAKVKSLLPVSEKYEWDVATEYSVHTVSQRMGLRLRSMYVHKDSRDNVDMYAVHDVYHFDKLISDDGYLKAVVDKLVQTIVNELARLEKERLKNEHYKYPDVHDSTEWPLAKKSGRSRLVREGAASDPKVHEEND